MQSSPGQSTGPYGDRVALPAKIGRYELVECIGAGGMGTVYKAYDPHLNRTVAVKVPRIERQTGDWEIRMERFQREARSAAQVWHPHVCPIYDVGEHQGQPFVVMAYVEGQSVAERLARHGCFTDFGEAVTLGCSCTRIIFLTVSEG
jgi:serine/threonine protein kinase